MRYRIIKVDRINSDPQFQIQYQFLYLPFIWFTDKTKFYGYTIPFSFNTKKEAIEYIKQQKSYNTKILPKEKVVWKEK